MDVRAYLNHIGLNFTPPTTIDGLYVLQDHHMRHVPFENLDVIMRRPLNLLPDSLFDKIVMQKRGGYCFELNTLYAALLRALGFNPVPMLGRVWLRDPEETPPRTHLMHRISIGDETWVTDVGFGGRASRIPLKMGTETALDDGDGRIRIIPEDSFGFMVQREQDGTWSNQYSFEPTAAPLADILCGNHWTESHPDSHFRQGIGVGLFTTEGRTSFYGGMLTHRGRGTQTVQVLGLDATLKCLRDEFGIELNADDKETANIAAAVI